MAEYREENQKPASEPNLRKKKCSCDCQCVHSGIEEEEEEKKIERLKYVSAYPYRSFVRCGNVSKLWYKKKHVKKSKNKCLKQKKMKVVEKTMM